MKTSAAVLVELNKPLLLVDLDVPLLKPGQVLVEVAFTAVCHTQVLECRGYRGADPYLPHCLGHEGSGTVIDIGQGVVKVKVGDRVILSWIKGSGMDVSGTVYKWDGRHVNAGAITTFHRHAVISENRLTVVPEGIPLRSAAMLGCVAPTGLGSVLNTAKPSPGQSLAVFGVGGVGLCAVAAALIAGCAPVIAIDIREDKLVLAREMGATHTVLAVNADPLQEVRSLCPRGLDFAVEASGRPSAMVWAFESVRPQGGAAVIVGNARRGERLDLDPWQFNLGKRLLGTWGGDTQPDRDIPRYARLIALGKLNLEPLMSKTYKLTDINEAIDDLEVGRAVRPLVDASAG